MHPKIDMQKISANSLKILQKYQILLNKLFQNDSLLSGNNVLDLSEVNKSFTDLFGKLYSDPKKMMELQSQYIRQAMGLVNYGFKRLGGENPEPLYHPGDKDKRFRDDSWTNNLFFDLVKQTYLMNVNWLHNLVDEIHIGDRSKLRANFFLRQVVDALSPSNFITTNPAVLRETIASSGDNLLKGLDNFIEDIDKSKQVFEINRVKPNSFKIGKNIACSKGKVILQNDMMQLIHYTPTKATNYTVPLLIVPPWINKYYILDLTEKNSFVHWLLEQGLSVYLISWVNPGADHADKSFDDYVNDGVIAAIKFIKKIENVEQINVLGYCLGGTLSCVTEAYLQSKNDNSIKSLTLLTTLLDFSDAGDILAFIDEEQLKKIEEKMAEDGYYDGDFMSSTFNLLRSNDMIWSFFINNYLLGKEPLPFDILFWNADSTRLPAKMHSFYLRNMYLRNRLSKPGGIEVMGIPIDLAKIKIPCYFLSAIDDHIAPWEAVYKANNLIPGDIRFILSGSGHVAGVVNPPIQNKYGYWTNENVRDHTSHEWLKHAEKHDGSWWVDWMRWIKPFAGKLESSISQDKFKKYHVEDAPGSYVLIK